MMLEENMALDELKQQFPKGTECVKDGIWNAVVLDVIWSKNENCALLYIRREAPYGTKLEFVEPKRVKKKQ